MEFVKLVEMVEITSELASITLVGNGINGRNVEITSMVYKVDINTELAHTFLVKIVEMMEIRQSWLPPPPGGNGGIGGNHN